MDFWSVVVDDFNGGLRMFGHSKSKEEGWVSAAEIVTRTMDFYQWNSDKGDGTGARARSKSSDEFLFGCEFCDFCILMILCIFMIFEIVSMH